MAIVPGSAFAAARDTPPASHRFSTSYTSVGGTTLFPGQILYANQSLVSTSGEMTLIMQGDGNLVLYRSGHDALWTSKTPGNPGAFVGMQTDGNLVLWNAIWRVLWASNTGGYYGASTTVQNDGNFVIYLNGVALWATNTVCIYPSVTYYGKGNFYNVFSETLNAEVCFNGSSVWTIWTNHKFSGLPGWNNTEFGRCVFWDPGKYGGALTIWSSDRDTFSVGLVTYNEDTFVRIWVKPNGQWYSYGGL